MTSPDITQKVLSRIHDEHVEPKPHWTFTTRNVLLWGMGILAIVIGGISLATILFILENNDWDTYSITDGNLLNFIFSTLPYGWLIILSALLVLAARYFRHTRHGYRYPLMVILGTVVGGSMAMGAFFHETGVGQSVDEIGSAHFPLYREVMHQRELRWSQPEQGLLSGTVTDAQDNTITIQDFRGRTWTIQKNEEMNGPILKRIEEGKRIRIIGAPTGEETFAAKRIAPWLPNERPRPILRFIEKKRTGVK